LPTESGLIVVDASVVIKWIFDDEECEAESRALRNDYARRYLRAIAPHLMVYEAINGVATATRGGRVSNEQAIDAIRDVLGRTWS
jgi:predicted nucleic acid-binding protein